MSSPSTIRVQYRLLRTGVCAAALLALASCSTVTGSGYPSMGRLDVARFDGTDLSKMTVDSVVRGLVSGDYTKMTPGPVELGIPTVDKSAPTLFDPSLSAARSTGDEALATLAGLRLRTGDATLPPPLAPQLAHYAPPGVERQSARLPITSVASWFSRHRTRLHDGLTAALRRERAAPVAAAPATGQTIRPLHIKVPSRDRQVAQATQVDEPKKPSFWSWILKGGDTSRPLPASKRAQIAAANPDGIDTMTTSTVPSAASAASARL